MQLGRGETIADTARVLSRYVDAIMMRTDDAAKLHELAQYATVPVINGLTDRSHPCQLMADVMTLRGASRPDRRASRGLVRRRQQRRAQLDRGRGALRLQPAPGLPRRACARRAEMLAWARARAAAAQLTDDPAEAVAGADCVVTDTWVSMGDEPKTSRHNLLAPYRVDERADGARQPDAIFMHCLPAHRGEEVTAEVIDGPQSVVFDEAENRLHAQKGILAWCLGVIAATCVPAIDSRRHLSSRSRSTPRLARPSGAARSGARPHPGPP